MQCYQNPNTEWGFYSSLYQHTKHVWVCDIAEARFALIPGVSQKHHGQRVSEAKHRDRKLYVRRRMIKLVLGVGNYPLQNILCTFNTYRGVQDMDILLGHALYSSVDKLYLKV